MMELNYFFLVVFIVMLVTLGWLDFKRVYWKQRAEFFEARAFETLDELKALQERERRSGEEWKL